MSIKQFDRETAKLMREKMEKTLQSLATEFGISITVGNCTFDNSMMNYKVKFSVLNADGKVESAEKKAFLQYAAILGMKTEDLEKTFVLRGKTYKLKGFAPRRRKFPMVCECGGKLVLIPEDDVKRALGYTVAA